MRVVIATFQPFPDGPPGSVQRFVDLQARGLASLGHEVCVAAMKGTWPGGRRAEFDGFSATRCQNYPVGGSRLMLKLRSISTRLLWCSYLSLLSVARRFDMIILLGNSPEFAVVSPIARLMGRRVYYLESDLPLPYRGKSWVTKLISTTVRRLQLVTTRTASAIIVAGTAVLQDYFKRLAPRTPQIHVLVPTDATLFGSGVGERARSRCGIDDSPLVVYTGAIDVLEGCDLLVRAMALVKKEHPRVKLLLAGKTHEVDRVVSTPIDFHLLAEQCGIADSLIMTGFVPGDEVIDLLAAADVLAMPKIDHIINHAVYPIKAGEYLASGRPMVSSRICELDVLLNDGEEVLFCEPGNVEELADCISRLLGDEALRRKIGEGGKVAAKRVFDHRAWAARVVELADSVK